MGKIIDLFTGKEIPSEPILTVTQSLIKSTNIKDRTHIDFTDPIIIIGRKYFKEMKY